MVRIEKVFQIPKANGLYENIKIAAEGETAEQCLYEIYSALYRDRIVSLTLDSKDRSKEIENINALIQRLNEILDAV